MLTVQRSAILRAGVYVLAARYMTAVTSSMTDCDNQTFDLVSAARIVASWRDEHRLHASKVKLGFT